MVSRKIERVMLMQPNFSWLGKRTRKLIPYSLGLLNAHLKRAGYDSWIFDPNFKNLSEEVVRGELRRARPDAVGVTTFSSEYLSETRMLTNLIREELPEAIVILGGILPTVSLETAAKDHNVDYFVLGEGEYRLPSLLDQLNSTHADLSGIDALAWGNPLNIQPRKGFIAGLDAVEFPDYGGLDWSLYGNYAHKYEHGIIPRQYPFAITLTARGCPYLCTFCSAAAVSGRAIRLRSAHSVLREIDKLYDEHRVGEVIFADDHFLASRDRAVQIMKGLIDRNYGLTWKCINLNVWHFDKELLELMRESGSYAMTVSIESGNQDVLRRIIRKPGKLDKVPGILDNAKSLGFEIAANFVIGFPGETWDQIRETVRYAENLNVDLVNFHIATPLPRTELMETSKRGGYLKDREGDDVHGYTTGLIETPEFRPLELQVLRAFEWDRINFGNPERKAAVARMEGISVAELEEWRVRTRLHLGTLKGWKV